MEDSYRLDLSVLSLLWMYIISVHLLLITCLNGRSLSSLSFVLSLRFFCNIIMVFNRCSSRTYLNVCFRMLFTDMSFKILLWGETTLTNITFYCFFVFIHSHSFLFLNRCCQNRFNRINFLLLMLTYPRRLVLVIQYDSFIHFRTGCIVFLCIKLLTHI